MGKPNGKVVCSWCMFVLIVWLVYVYLGRYTGYARKSSHTTAITSAYIEYVGKHRGKLLHLQLTFGRGSLRTLLYACIWCICSAVSKVRHSAAHSWEIANPCERRTSPWPTCWRITLLLWRSKVLALALLASSALPRCHCTRRLVVFCRPHAYS